MRISVDIRGDRELALRFDQFPAVLHARLERRITAITQELEARVEAATPVRTGKLRSEVRPSVYSNNRDRVAGYVQVFAPGDPREYPKAATLEYGSDKPRRRFERASGLLGRVGAPRRRLLSRGGDAVHIRAYRYLRGPFESMQAEIEAALQQEIDAAAAEGGE